MSEAIGRWRRTTLRWNGVALAIVAACILVSAMAGAYGSLRLFASEQEVAHARAFMRSLERVVALETDLETAQRGFVITGREEYLQPYVDGLPQIQAELDRLGALDEGDRARAALVGQLRALIQDKQAEMAAVIDTRRRAGFDAAQVLVMLDAGKNLMDQARRVVQRLEVMGEEDVGERLLKARQARNLTIYMTASIAALTIALCITCWYLMRRAVIAETASLQEIEDRKEWLRVTLSSIGDGVITVDDRGLVTFANPAAAELSGWRPEEALGKPVQEVLVIRHEQTREPVPNPALVALQERCVVGLANHSVLIARDGRETYVDDSGAPILDDSGRLLGAVLVFRDVTARKLFEDEVRESDRRKGEFLAILSHELRNPLGAVRSALSAASRNAGDALAQQRLREMMQRQIVQMTRLLDDLLDVARIAKGALELRMGPCSMSDVVRVAIETAEPRLVQAGCVLATELPEAPLWMRADGARLAQAVSNLLANAAKYSPQGARVTLRVWREDEQVVIEVADQGIGLCAEDKERIFEMFFQVDRTSDAAREGLGIGLPLAKHIAALHGGKIDVASDGPGKGTTFTIRLPLAGTPAESVAPPVKADLAALAGEHVLLADDNEDAAEALAMVLRSHGLTVHTAFDGEDALRLASELRPRIVLLDLGMPKRSGYEVATILRAEQAFSPVLIAITGWGQQGDRLKTRETGFDAHLTKPLDIDLLLETICAVLSASPR